MQLEHSRITIELHPDTGRRWEQIRNRFVSRLSVSGQSGLPEWLLSALGVLPLRLLRHERGPRVANWVERRMVGRERKRLIDLRRH